jgi:hypothetical protein
MLDSAHALYRYTSDALLRCVFVPPCLQESNNRDNQIAMVTLAVSLLGGMALGASPWGVEESLQGSWAAVPSNMLGWSYFLAWSISFYVSGVARHRR